MNFWRAILASLLSLVCTVAVSAFVTLQTVNTTLLDRGEVKSWIANSGAYNQFLSTILDSSPQIKQRLAGLDSSATRTAANSALAETFPPSFVQQSTEHILDGTYNWLDGKQPTIQFEINTTRHREAYIKNLAAKLEPHLAALPRCESLSQFDSSNPTCLPPTTSAATAAELTAINTAQQAAIFTRPINTANFSQFASTTGETNTPANPAPQVPQAIGTMRYWLMWLPVIALVSGVLMVLLSQHRLKAAKHLAGRLTFGMAITCALGLMAAYFGQTLRLSDYMSGSANATILSNIVDPILHQAVPAIGNRLAFVSGITGGLTLAAWIMLRVIKKHRDKIELLKSPIKQPPQPTASKTEEPNAPQPAPQPASPPKDGQK